MGVPLGEEVCGRRLDWLPCAPLVVCLAAIGWRAPTSPPNAAHIRYMYLKQQRPLLSQKAESAKQHKHQGERTIIPAFCIYIKNWAL